VGVSLGLLSAGVNEKGTNQTLYFAQFGPYADGSFRFRAMHPPSSRVNPTELTRFSNMRACDARRFDRLQIWGQA